MCAESASFLSILQFGVLGLVLATASLACSTVRGSAVRTGGGGEGEYQGQVRITAFEPRGAQQVGLIQARGQEPIDQLAEEFRSQAAKVGGNVAKVDDVTTKFEMVTRTETYSYSCGTSKAPQTCTGTRTVTTEVCTTQLVGRAFRSEYN